MGRNCKIILKTFIYLLTLFSAIGIIEAPQPNQIFICIIVFIFGVWACWKINN